MEFILTESPIYINWNYTNQCNFNCIHCYSRGRKEKELSTAEYLEIVEFLAKSNVFHVNLGGGEPTLRKDFLKISQALSKKNIKVSLSSNAWNIDKSLLMAIKESSIETLILSLDHSIPKKHDIFRGVDGSYSKVINVVKLAHHYNVKVKISTVITKLNFHILEDIIKIAESEECKSIDFKRFKPTGNGSITKQQLNLDKREEEALYSEIIKWKNKYSIEVNLIYGDRYIEGIDYGCPCGKTSLSIFPNGDIAPCVYSNLIIGNIMKDDLSTVWKSSPKLKTLRKNFSCLGL